MIRRAINCLPILGILCGLGLYFRSASLYSMATHLDPVHRGYHHLGNYWCDLFATVTYTGEVNLGRADSLAATFTLIVTLFLFWFSVSTLFAELVWLRWIVRVAGGVAAVAASLIFTPLHDVVITIAAPLGFVAVTAACIGLARKRQWVLLGLGISGVVVGLLDYSLWKMASLELYQPAVQKSAFVLVFLWVLVTAIKVLRMPARKVAVVEFVQ